MSTRRLAFGFLAILLAVVVARPASAQAPTTTITFDELELGTNIQGVTLKGATFGYEEGGIGPAIVEGAPDTKSVQTVAVKGGAEGCARLTITFDKPTTTVAFGLALNSDAAWLGNDAYVRLYSPGARGIRQLIRVELDPTLNQWRLPEGTFSYSGPAVDRAEVTFFENGPLGCTGDWPGVYRFWLDNLTFQAKPNIKVDRRG